MGRGSDRTWGGVLHDRRAEAAVVARVRSIVDGLVEGLPTCVAYLTDENGVLVAVAGDPQDAHSTAVAEFYAEHEATLGRSLQQSGFARGVVQGDRFVHLHLIDQRVLLTLVANKVSLGVMSVRLRKASAELNALISPVPWLPPQSSGPGGTAPAAAHAFVGLDLKSVKTPVS